MARRYTRVHRLLRILTLIQSGGSWNVRRLAEECGTTPRTIHRDLNMLEGARVPYFFDAESGGYRIRGDFFMPPVELTLEEALAIICLAEQAGGREQIPFMKPAGKVVAKLRSQLPAALRDRLDELSPHMELRLAAAMPPEGVADVYELVRRAIAQRRALRCRYESLRSVGRGDGGGSNGTGEEFILRPYCLFFGQRAWYVVGHHSARDALRCLKLNRFTQVRPTATPYVIPAGFTLERYLGKAWRMIPGSPVHPVVLEFDAAFAENIADTHWHDTQQIVWHDDGSITFRCEVAGLDEIVWWVLSMGPHCVVRRPKELADRVRELAKATAAKYVNCAGTRPAAKARTRRRSVKFALGH